MDGAPLSKKLSCLEDIRRRILIQALEPGTYLDEVDLAEAYGISRPPLARNAAATGRRRLCRPARKPRRAGRADVAQDAAQFLRGRPDDLFRRPRDLRPRHATPAQIVRLKMSVGLPSGDQHRATRPNARCSNQRFHMIIGEMADNEFLMPSLRRLLIDHTRIAMTFYNPRKADWPCSAMRPPTSTTSSST
jgi:DNA-binding GntR family transcriptional regulator